MQTKTSRFVAACRREPVDTTPIWMMRQAGRCLPAYRELRTKYAFLDLVKKPDLMAEVTLMPIDALEVDAAVLFADIMLPLASLGIEFDIVESIGPVIPEPVVTREQIEAMSSIPIPEAVPAVLETIGIVKRELNGRVPVIGFSGAPFTLACYLIEGKPSREFAKAKAFMFTEPELFDALMERLTAMIVEYLSAQVDAGVDAVQLFDSWLGVLGPVDASERVLPYTKRIFDSLADRGVPRVAFGTNTASLLELIAATGSDVVSVDWRVHLDDAWARIGHDKGIQGNLEPNVLFGPRELVEERAKDVLDRAGGRPGHVFNLGHGVQPGTPLDNLRALVDVVHTYEPKR